MRKLLGLTFGVALAAMAFGATGAMAFPDGPVEVIVPSGPGSGMDNLARVIARHLEADLGQPFPVVNTPGAGQTTAARALVDADADGYTIMIAHPQLLVSAVQGMLGYELLDKLVPLAQTARMENFLASPANAPFKNLAELATYAKAHPGEVNVAIDGILGLDHIVMMQLADEMGVDFNYVNIPGGGPPKVQSLMGGFSQLGVLGPGPFGGAYKSGDLAGVATLTNSDQVSPAFPDIPTTKAQDYSAEFSLSWWWFAKAGTPPDRLKVIEDAIAAVMADPAAQQEMLQAGLTEPSYADPETARKQIEQQLDGVKKIVDKLAAQ